MVERGAMFNHHIAGLTDMPKDIMWKIIKTAFVQLQEPFWEFKAGSGFAIVNSNSQMFLPSPEHSVLYFSHHFSTIALVCKKILFVIQSNCYRQYDSMLGLKTWCFRYPFFPV